MKKTSKSILTGIFFILILTLSIFAIRSTESNSWILKFPFESILNLIKWLGLKGTMGNVFATILYVLISISPLYLVAYRKKREKASKADILLFILSGSLFFSFYIGLYPVNNSIISVEPFMEFLPYSLNLLHISLVLAYLVILYIEALDKEEAFDPTRLLKGLLYFVIVLCTASIFLTLLPSYFKSFEKISKETNNIIMMEPFEEIEEKNFPAMEMEPFSTMDKEANYLSTGLSFAYDLFPMALAILASHDLIRILDLEDKKEEALEKTKKLLKGLTGKLKYGLISFMLLGIIVNMYNLLHITKLTSASIHLRFPFSLLIYLIFLFTIASYIQRNRDLEEDNRLFV